MHPDEEQAQAVLFLCNAVAYYGLLRHCRATTADGQRFGVPLVRVQVDLHRTRDQAQLHATLLAADRGQSREVHPVRVA